MRRKGNKMKTPLGAGAMKTPLGAGALIIALTVFFLYAALKPEGQGGIDVRDVERLLPKDIASGLKEGASILHERPPHERRIEERPNPSSPTFTSPTFTTRSFTTRSFTTPLSSPLSSPLHLKVIKVTDGDTILVENPGTHGTFKCRLYGIDAPETPKHGQSGQPYGEDATRALEALVSGVLVDVTTTGEKTYDREVCSVRVGGTDVNLEMIKRGYAWAYRHYLYGDYASEYIEAENEARRNRLGIWHEIKPTPPWEFRRRKDDAAREAAPTARRR